MIDKEKYDFIDHVVHLALSEEDRLLNEHGGEYCRLQEDGIDSNEYYRIITERVISILKKTKNYMQEEPVSEDLEDYSALIADEIPQGIALTSNGEFDIASVRKLIRAACKLGAQWKKKQMMN